MWRSFVTWWRCRKRHDWIEAPGRPDDLDPNYDWEQACSRCGAKW